jgi:hypothetical protein
MAELRHLLLVVTWPAAEIAARPVVALTALMFTTTLEPAFLQLVAEVVVVAAAAATGHISLSFLGSRRDGNTTPAGCKFFLYCDVESMAEKNWKYLGTMLSDASSKRSSRTTKH